MGEGKKRCRLDMSMKPVPTIFDPSTHESSSTSALKAPIRIPRKCPKQRNVFADEYVEFANNDKIMKFEGIDETSAPPGYTIAKYENHIVFYKIEHDEFSIPQVTECIRIDDKLHVKLYFKGSPVPLTKWFRHGHDCHLSRKSMLENFPSHIQAVVCQNKTVFDELKEFKMSPVYAPGIIRFTLMLRYTSVQSYKLLLDEFRLPSLPLLRKIVIGDIDAVKSAKLLKDEEKISSDVCFIFDEMYLQKCEEYKGGQLIGAAKNGQLYKGTVSFMIIGIKQNSSYIIKSVSEIKIHADWLKNQIIGYLKVLTDCGFKVRMIISDNHLCNTSSYHKILNHFNTPCDN